MVHVKTSRKKSVILLGWYGYNNLGDDLLFEIISKDLKKVFNKLYFPCNPNNNIITENDFLKPVKLKGRLQFLILVYYIIKCDCLVLGGGTYLRDLISSKILRYKLYIIYIAQKLKKTTIIWGGGIGPFYFNKNTKLLKSVLSNFDHVLLRDNNSNKVFKEITGKNSILVPDPVYQLYNNIKCNYVFPKKIRSNFRIGLSLREWGSELGVKDFSYYEKFIISMKSFLCELNKSYDLEIYCFISQNSLDDSMSSDKSVYDDIFNSSAEFNFKYISFNNDLSDLMTHMGKINCMIGMRLHSLILASCLNVPLLGISYDIKVRSLMKDLNIYDCCINYKDIDSIILMKVFLETFNQDYNTYLENKVHNLIRYSNLIKSI